ncbi:hypothetical protein ACQR1Y_09850 [Bradyrhizobium sp. HKCCYLRH3099]|uniref:hypothetical protein n=1 Tax=unclassified Bradyrhizobium TaxID=2631580 RepID=UPI003EC01B83
MKWSPVTTSNQDFVARSVKCCASITTRNAEWREGRSILVCGPGAFRYFILRSLDFPDFGGTATRVVGGCSSGLLRPGRRLRNCVAQQTGSGGVFDEQERDGTRDRKVSVAVRSGSSRF